MTPKERAEALVRSRSAKEILADTRKVLVVGCGCCYTDSDEDENVALVEAALEAAIAAEREACALAVCWFCREGRPLGTGEWARYHPGKTIDGDECFTHCAAAAIRARGSG